MATVYENKRAKLESEIRGRAIAMLGEGRGFDLSTKEGSESAFKDILRTDSFLNKIVSGNLSSSDIAKLNSEEGTFYGTIYNLQKEIQKLEGSQEDLYSSALAKRPGVRSQSSSALIGGTRERSVLSALV